MPAPGASSGPDNGGPAVQKPPKEGNPRESGEDLGRLWRFGRGSGFCWGDGFLRIAESGKPLMVAELSAAAEPDGPIEGWCAMGFFGRVARTGD